MPPGTAGGRRLGRPWRTGSPSPRWRPPEGRSSWRSRPSRLSGRPTAPRGSPSARSWQGCGRCSCRRGPTTRRRRSGSSTASSCASTAAAAPPRPRRTPSTWPCRCETSARASRCFTAGASRAARSRAAGLRRRSRSSTTLTRDLYVAAGRRRLLAGGLPRSRPTEFARGRAAAIAAGERLVIDMLYGDHEGGQRVISRFSLCRRRATAAGSSPRRATGTSTATTLADRALVAARSRGRRGAPRGSRLGGLRRHDEPERTVKRRDCVADHHRATAAQDASPPPASQASVVRRARAGRRRRHDRARHGRVRPSPPDRHPRALLNECYSSTARTALERLLPAGSAVQLQADPALDRDGPLRAAAPLRLPRRPQHQHRDGAARSRGPVLLQRRRGRYAARIYALAVAAKTAHRGLWGACRATQLRPDAAVARSERDRRPAAAGRLAAASPDTRRALRSSATWIAPTSPPRRSRST